MEQKDLTVENNQNASADNTTGFSLEPKTFDQALKFADMMSKSDLVPKDFKGKPGNCLIAMQMGYELGVKPMQAVQNIAVINGRPAIWGDLLPALIQSHTDHEYMNETFDESTMTATCEIKRKNQPQQVRTFSRKDAELAGLWGKAGPWKQYPKRMLQMRARAFAIRDVFADALKGVQVAEEQLDVEKTDYSDVAKRKPVQPRVFDVDPNVEKINDDQLLQIESLIADNELNFDQVSNWIKKKIDVIELSDIPIDRFNDAILMVKKSIEVKQKNEASVNNDNP